MAVPINPKSILLLMNAVDAVDEMDDATRGLLNGNPAFNGLLKELSQALKETIKEATEINYEP